MCHKDNVQLEWKINNNFNVLALYPKFLATWHITLNILWIVDVIKWMDTRMWFLNRSFLDEAWWLKHWIKNKNIEHLLYYFSFLGKRIELLISNNPAFSKVGGNYPLDLQIIWSSGLYTPLRTWCLQPDWGYFFMNRTKIAINP
jgi:hypothetical protein